MNPEERKAVFAETHKAIDEAAQCAINLIGTSNSASLSYPPGVELTEEEIKLISSIQLSIEAKNVLKKIIANSCSWPIFHMMSLLDGVTDPYVIEVKDWIGGTLHGDEDGSMLHDEFYETYWDYIANAKG